LAEKKKKRKKSLKKYLLGKAEEEKRGEGKRGWVWVECMPHCPPNK
jgi:hypothetical protein